MRIAKILGGVGALMGAALLGGAMISGALAGTDPEVATPSAATGADHPIDGTYADAYLNALAAELGVDRAQLGPAAVAAAGAAIDAAVEAGDIDADVAETLKSRLAELDDPAAVLMGRGAIPGYAGPGSFGAWRTPRAR